MTRGSPGRAAAWPAGAGVVACRLIRGLESLAECRQVNGVSRELPASEPLGLAVWKVLSLE